MSRAVRAEETEARLDPHAERGPRLPAREARDLPVIGVVVADVDRLSLAREGDEAEGPAAVDLHQELRQVLQADRRSGAQIQHLPERAVVRRRQQERVDAVLDVVEVAQLRAVAEDLDLVSEDEVPEPDAEERLPRIPDAHPGAVRVRHPDGDGRDPVNAMIE